MRSWLPAAIAFTIAGILELMFLALSFIGTLMGGAMTFGNFGGQMPDDVKMIGPMVLVMYFVWGLATVVSGPLHLVSGVMFLMGSRNRTLLWASTIASLFPMLTMYCIPTSLIAGVLGLVTAIMTAQPADESEA